MAIIQDSEGFKIKITPKYTNWWSYYIEFFYKDKPLFNPEIMENRQVKADEYSNSALLPILEKSLRCTTHGEKFIWNEWEDEAVIIIEYYKFNKLAEDGFFSFSAFVSEYFLKGGSGNTMNQPLGLELGFIYRYDLYKFYRELNDEMLPIYDKLPDDHKGEGIGSRPKNFGELDTP